ncbi:MAG: indole-3-glycerol phosphate synthase TrpC [Elusimicrobiota bacterium]|jgi:indole-3-glycerol phosphate synthase|nr:indole-3-glycerol phosphate synthase TrpC [Elusimicrobiota bacterium]
MLNKIISATKIRVEKTKNICPFEKMKSDAISMCGNCVFNFPFKKVLSEKKMNFICEIKKASPSKGLISNDFKYKEIALEYEKGGASAVSVLTETKFFLGKNKYLSEIKSSVKIPVLRKDFIIDKYQIYEAKTIGADAILLICAILDFQTLKYFFETANSIGLSCLVETHNEREVENALKINADIIGVNNRNLENFEVDINNSIALRKLVPQDKIFVSESGIKTRTDIGILKENNINVVLIGEELMKSENILEKLEKLKGV